MPEKPPKTEAEKLAEALQPKPPQRQRGRPRNRTLTLNDNEGQSKYPAEIKNMARHELDPALIKRFSRIAHGRKPERDAPTPTIRESQAAADMLGKWGDINASAPVHVSDSDVVRVVCDIAQRFVPESAHVLFYAAVKQSLGHLVHGDGLLELPDGA